MDLDKLLLNHEPAIRVGLFFGVFAAMAAWELIAPRRALSVSKTQRWTANLLLVVLNTAIIRILFPVAAVGVAAFAAERGAGLLNFHPVPYPLAIAISVLLLDFAIYLQHLMFHAVPVLWRLHRVHHADPDFDVTTGARFHPLEIVLSMLIKFAVIVALGAPVIAVLIFEVLLNAAAMFNHANVRIPAAWDRVLRLLVVTPDMHRVHHSPEAAETNSNFGFNLPWWDRLLGTYRDQPQTGHTAMTIGIHTFRDPRQCARLPGMLAMPFAGAVTEYAINRRGNQRSRAAAHAFDET